MDKIEKIRQEIERLKGICTAQIKANPGQTFPFVMEMTGYDKLLSFLDTLSEEPDKSLEEAAENYRRKSYNTTMIPPLDGPTDEYGGNIKNAFIAGAEWMEKEINKELIKAMEKVHEIRDVDYDIHVDISANGSFNRLNIIQNEK